MCKNISNKYHSKYTRTIKDCSILGKSVTLVIEAKKAFCLNISCKRKIFTERLSSLVNSYSRVTIRLEKLLEKLAFSVSAEQASKLALYFGTSKSPHYFLRLIRKSDVNNLNTKKYVNIGVDDFAFKKGCNYGSLICDLDTKKPIDVLDSRDTESFQNWLEKNPQIKIVSRDRATTYTKAINIVNQEICQIADKFHVLKNMFSLLSDFISNKFSKGIYKLEEKFESINQTDTELTDKEKAKWNKVLEVKDVYNKLKSIRKTSKVLELSGETVKKYIEATETPKYKSHKKGSILDKHILKIKESMEKDEKITVLYNKISLDDKSFSLPLLYRYVKDLKKGINKIIINKVKIASKFKIINLFWRQADILSDEQIDTLNEILKYDVNLTELYVSIQIFRKIFVSKDIELLNLWINQNVNSSIKKVADFTISIKKDYISICNSLKSKYTNSILEGNVNRLKVIKRVMYGRAKFDLLRAKILYSF